MVFEEILKRICKGIDVCFACKNDDHLKKITINFFAKTDANNNMFLRRIEIYKINSYIIKIIFTVYLHHLYHFSNIVAAVICLKYCRYS